jgi:hypothetical protein
MGLEVEKGSEMIVRRGPGGGAGKGGMAKTWRMVNFQDL